MRIISILLIFSIQSIAYAKSIYICTPENKNRCDDYGCLTNLPRQKQDVAKIDLNKKELSFCKKNHKDCFKVQDLIITFSDNDNIVLVSKNDQHPDLIKIDKTNMKYMFLTASGGLTKIKTENGKLIEDINSTSLYIESDIGFCIQK